MTNSNVVEEPKTRVRKSLGPMDKKVRDWILGHRGVLVQVAKECDVSLQFVSRIAYRTSYCKSGGLRVERALKVRGCPGIRVG